MTLLNNEERRVLELLQQGQKAEFIYGFGVYVGSRPVCHLPTMEALERRGLVIQTEPSVWVISDKGAALEL